MSLDHGDGSLVRLESVCRTEKDETEDLKNLLHKFRHLQFVTFRSPSATDQELFKSQRPAI